VVQLLGSAYLDDWPVIQYGYLLLPDKPGYG
jgi:hypothetical protein